MIGKISLGCNGRGVQHKPGRPPSVDEQFRLVKEAGVFDHFDRRPQPGQEAEYARASERHGLPIRTGLWTYRAGKDEEQLKQNLQICKAAGAECHGVLLYAHHADGHILTNSEIADFYLYSRDCAERIGLAIAFEVHIYMWSEDFRRVVPVAEMVRRQGSQFNFVLDHSHVLLKVDNLEEQDVSGIREDVEAGRLIIDPYEEGNIVDGWIAQNMIAWLQVRPASPNGPKNQCELKGDGSWGRACQYPFVRPRPGEWFTQWHAYRVEPCKEIARRVLRHHHRRPDSPLRWVTTDMIDMPDYGGGVKYSLFEQNVAIAQWIRSTWEQISGEKPNAAPRP